MCIAWICRKYKEKGVNILKHKQKYTLRISEGYKINCSSKNVYYVGTGCQALFWAQTFGHKGWTTATLSIILSSSGFGPY